MMHLIYLFPNSWYDKLAGLVIDRVIVDATRLEREQRSPNQGKHQ